MIGEGLAIVLSGFPRRSETFALAELLALDAAGMVGAIFATKPGESAASQPGTEQVAARVQILDGDPAAQARSAAAWLHGKQLAGVHAYFADSAMTGGRIFITAVGAADPTSQPGDIWLAY